MNSNSGKIFVLLLTGMLLHAGLFAQLTLSNEFQNVVPGKQYTRSNLHQFLWGRHYRKEWATPVRFPVFRLDSVAGGLQPYQAGGGNQSNTLRLRNAQGREYVLRSISKSYDKVLPEIYRNTFVEKLLNDQVSAVHPYAALSVPTMADAAGIYHTKPVIVYVPKQPALDSFNERFGDGLFLFEQRPDENWEDADHFGNSKKIIGTERLLERLNESSNHIVDQPAFIKARLFDMLIGDWGRHEDQWRWASVEEGGKTLYKPIPRDRDQLYTKFDGLLMNMALSGAGMGHLQSFGSRIHDIGSYNYPARYLDRRLANEATRDQWIEAARALQQSITNEVIEKAVRALPQEAFSISGETIIAALKSRRDKLADYATEYYEVLAEEVEVTGTDQRDLFEIDHGDEATQVRVYAYNNGRAEKQAYYTRRFNKKETEELRLYGLAGADVFTVTGADDGVKVRIIGGGDSDQVTVSGGKRRNTVVYDDTQDHIAGDGARVRRSTDSVVHAFNYRTFHSDEKGFKPQLFYNYEDKLFVGLGYEITQHKWRREPFAHEHGIYARYSVIQRAPSFTYKGTVHQFIGKWSLNMFAQYDAIRWTNFFGTGNETREITDDRNYYRMRSREILGSIAINRKLGNYFSFSVGPFYHNIEIISDKERYLAQFVHNGNLYEEKHFAGALATLRFSRLDDPVLPRKGLELLTSATHTVNIDNRERTFQKYGAAMGLYLPLVKRLVAAVRAGAGTVNGDPEFYQLTSIGGSNSLRGFRRDRFWGKSSFFAANELQYQFNIRSFLFNGKAALFGLYDIGRVWEPVETSETLHSAYGGGLSFAPFNKVLFSLAYAVSKERGVLHLRFGKTF